MLRLQERCRISDDCWFRAVLLLDRMLALLDAETDETQNMQSHVYHTAAVCLYMFSKMYDDKYLTVNVLIQGVETTSLPSNIVMEQLTINKVHALEMRLLQLAGLSLSTSSIVTIMDLFNIYFEAARTKDEPRFSIQRCRYFGQYLAAMSMFYPSSLYSFGTNMLAAAISLLVIRICDFKVKWT